MGKSLEELESIPTAYKLYLKLIEGNIDQIFDLMNSMKLGESNVEVNKYPTKADAQLLRNAMRYYDPKYDESVRKKNNQSNMKRIN